MIKVLLVDDEFLARNAVMALFAGGPPGQVSLREAVNGQEAVAQIEKERPDIALIDVSMPVMGGLDLLAWIQEHAPQIHCVMLSSYSDFEYVRQAMKRGARDYLLKHQLTLEGLLDMLSQTGLLEAPGREALPECGREAELETFLREGGREGTLPWAVDSLFFAVTPRWAGQAQDIKTHLHSVLETSRHLLAQEEATVALPHQRALACVFPQLARESQGQHQRRVQKAQKMLAEALARYHNVTLSFSEVKRCESLSTLRNLYLFEMTGAEGTGAPPSYTLQPPLALENALTTAVLHNQQEGIRELIDQAFERTRGQERETRALDNALSALLKKCYGYLLHIQEPAYPRQQAPDLGRYYREAFSALAEKHRRMTYSGFPELIRKTLAYLNAHCTQDISLSDVAEHLSINYSYLSYLFKKETGTGINQYINAARVSNCMRLMLLQDCSVSEAHEQAGFKHYGHFVSVFKSVTGLSPTAFRKHEHAFDYMMRFSALRPEPLATAPNRAERTGF